MKKSLVWFVFAFLILPSLAFGQNLVGESGDTRDVKFFAQTAVGEGWTATFQCVNRMEQPHLVGIYVFLFEPDGRRANAADYVLVDDEGRTTPWEFFDEDGGGFNYAVNIVPDSPVGDYNMRTLRRKSPGFVVGWVAVKQDEENENVSCSQTLRFNDGVGTNMASVLPAKIQPSYIPLVFAAAKDSQRTGIAVANPHREPIEVTFELRKPGGPLNGLRVVMTIPARGHLSKFWTELFPQYTQDPYFQKGQAVGALMKISFHRPDGTPMPLAVSVYDTLSTPAGFSFAPLSAVVR